MAYADIDAPAAAMASTMQQVSMSFDLACGSLVTAFYPDDLPLTDPLGAHAFITLTGQTLVSSLSFRALRPNDGENVSKGLVLAER